MTSLPKLLQTAASNEASEVVVDSGRQALITVDGRGEPLGEPISEGELFDALGTVLAPEQQAELAVGNVVAFDLESGERCWKLVAEPGPDGIRVRARLGGTEGSSEAPEGIDLPPLDPFSSESSPAAPSEGVERNDGAAPAHAAPSQAQGPDPVDLNEVDFELGGSGAVEPGEEEALTALEPGALCFVQGRGQGAAFARQVAGSHVIVDDEAHVPPLPGPQDDAAIVVTCEDPGRHLSWLLRRLEEGRRIVVETDARTAAGARRMLLGIDPGSHAEAWLACHPLRWIVEQDGGWKTTEL